jgi:hypothetical protein
MKDIDSQWDVRKCVITTVGGETLATLAPGAES